MDRDPVAPIVQQAEQANAAGVRIDDVVLLRLKHACGGSEWIVVRVGADIGLKCRTCRDRRILVPRSRFEALWLGGPLHSVPTDVMLVDLDGALTPDPLHEVDLILLKRKIGNGTTFREFASRCTGPAVDHERLFEEIPYLRAHWDDLRFLIVDALHAVGLNVVKKDQSDKRRRAAKPITRNRQGGAVGGTG